MFSSYDLTSFSKKLKAIRKSLGYSQTEVYEKTGINSDTLRRLENGLSIPRFDTLEVLSQFYKENLIILLDSYKISSTLSYFYDLIDYYMVHEDFAALEKTIIEFEEHIRTNPPQIIDKREITQLNLFFRGLQLSYSNDPNDKKKAIETLEDALVISNPGFQLKTWSNYKYNFLELRILFAIASIEGAKRNCVLSNEITIYILGYLDPSPRSKFYEKLLIVKSYCIIAYNYHRLEENIMVIEHANKGIQFCIDNSIMAYMHLLLFRKGTAMYHINLKGFETFIIQSVQLLRIQDKHNVADQYETYLKNYLLTQAKKISGQSNSHSN